MKYKYILFKYHTSENLYIARHLGDSYFIEELFIEKKSFINSSVGSTHQFLPAIMNILLERNNISLEAFKEICYLEIL